MALTLNDISGIFNAGKNKHTSKTPSKIIEELKRSGFDWDEVKRELEREIEEEEQQRRATRVQFMPSNSQLTFFTGSWASELTTSPNLAPRPRNMYAAPTVAPAVADEFEDVKFEE